MLRISVIFLLISTNLFALNRLPRAKNELDSRLIADTYEYGAEFGFCIPYDNCYKN